jgi:hypothetical protein
MALIAVLGRLFPGTAYSDAPNVPELVAGVVQVVLAMHIRAWATSRLAMASPTATHRPPPAWRGPVGLADTNSD